MSNEKYIGLDVHQATISVAVMDSQGKVVMESILETKASTLLEFVLVDTRVKIAFASLANHSRSDGCWDFSSRWRSRGWIELPKVKLYEEFGLVNLISLIPFLGSRVRS